MAASTHNRASVDTSPVRGAAPEHVVETPEAVGFSLRLAGLGSRGIAFAIDLGLLALGLLAVAVVTVGILAALQAFGGPAATQLVPWIVGAAIVVAFSGAWGYFIFGEVAMNGRTPGKRWIGIRVVRDDGSRVGGVDSAIRNILRIVDFLPGDFAVGVASIALTPSAKRVGDFAAGTVVVYDEGDVVTATPAAVDPRAALVIDYLARRGSLTAAARDQVADSLLAMYTEERVPGWDEPTCAGRLAQLAGVTSANPEVDGSAA
jgi:uncharacterized RDD family membrane protein YckC